ncbi:MAG: hypothetical protein ACR2OM_14945 [Aestuariivirgaceae bacterium]
MRFSGALALVVLLAACSQAKPPSDAPANQAGVPENIYQPTVHAILALSGGYSSSEQTQAIETVWRRAGADQSVRLALTPGTVTVRAMLAGRYVLDSLVVDGHELLVTGDDGRKASPVSDVVLDPGDVTYVGDMLVREGVPKQGASGSDRKRNMVLRIGTNADRARQAVAVKYARQSGQMQTRPLRRRK